MDLPTAQAIRSRRWPVYLVAVLAPLLGLTLRLSLGDGLVSYPFLCFFPVMLVTALLGGLDVAGR